MKNKLLILSTLVLGSMSVQPLLAQTASAPTRAEVKSDIPTNRTKDAAPTLERPAPRGQEKPLASGDNQPKTREEVREETKRANRAGELKGKGDTDTPPMEDKKNASKAKPTKAERQQAREARKPEGAAAARNPDNTGGVYDSSKDNKPKP